MHYTILQNELKTKGLHQYELADYLGVTASCVSARINGKTPWPIEDCYKVLALIGREPSDISQLFPPSGISVSRKPTSEQYADVLHALRDVCATMAAQIDAVTA